MEDEREMVTAEFAPWKVKAFVLSNASPPVDDQ